MRTEKDVKNEMFETRFQLEINKRNLERTTELKKQLELLKSELKKIKLEEIKKERNENEKYQRR